MKKEILNLSAEKSTRKGYHNKKLSGKRGLFSALREKFIFYLSAVF